MSPFELATAGRVLFGAGVRRQLAAAVVGAGAGRVLLVTGSSAGRAAPLAADLEGAGLAVTRIPIGGEPTLDVVRAGVAMARAAGAGPQAVVAVVAVGGGSA
ncbi:MAG: iron-containing alcohol dehydrogenase, partial [Pseudomonadota bacterium]